MSIRAFLRRRQHRTRGQSLAEFALILPIFLVVLSTAIDLGRIAYGRVTIANVAREASFQAAQTPTSYLPGQPCTSTNKDSNKVICRALLESKGSVITVDPADISLSCSPSCGEAMGNKVTVAVQGHFNLLTPVMAVFFGGTAITFSSSSTNQVSALPAISGVPAPPPASTTVPDLVGLNESLVPPVLTTAALVAGTRSDVYDNSIPVGSVVSQSPIAGSTVAGGSAVNYAVSLGPAPDCRSVSAGFTYTQSPDTGISPVMVSVTDATTYNTSCPTVWAWDWGDGVTTYGQNQPTHVYYNTGKNVRNYKLSLTVTSGSITSTFGGYTIQVKPRP